MNLDKDACSALNAQIERERNKLEALLKRVENELENIRTGRFVHLDALPTLSLNVSLSLKRIDVLEETLRCIYAVPEAK